MKIHAYEQHNSRTVKGNQHVVGRQDLNFETPRLFYSCFRINQLQCMCFEDSTFRGRRRVCGSFEPFRCCSSLWRFCCRRAFIAIVVVHNDRCLNERILPQFGHAVSPG